MGGTGSDGNGLMGMAPAGGGGGFLSGIPWWVYAIVILIGLGISLFCFVQYKATRRRAMIAPAPLPGSPPPLPGAPPPPPAPMPGAGNGFLIGGIAAALLLVLAPLVTMLIMQPWGDNWIVGRWAERPGCMGDTVEFTSGGMVIANGRTLAYELVGDRIIVDGRTETIQHDGDRLTVRNETMYRCSGAAGGGSGASGTSGSLTSTANPYGATPSTPAPSYGSPSTTVPSYASWVIGRWSDSDCRRSMEFRSDGTATTANGQPATFTVTPNGPGVGITIQGGPDRIAGYLDPDGSSGAILRAYAPSSRTINLRRCY